MLDFSRTRIDRHRPLSSYAKVRWLVTRLIRNRRVFYRPVTDGAYLNLGCGSNVTQGYLNIDAGWVPGLDICCDMSRGLPVPPECSAGVFSEHCLEHLPLAAAKALLAECCRVMKPGAFIRIIVPDLELYARAYVQALEGKPAVLPNEWFVNRTGLHSPVAVFNELFYGPSHRFIYDFQALSELLAGAGFVDARRHAFRVGSDARLLIDQPGHISESLYVEARKPARA